MATEALFHEPPPRTGRRIRRPGGRGLRVLGPEQRDRELALAGHPIERRAQLVDSARKRGPCGVVGGERRSETHRKAWLYGADPLEEPMVLQGVVSVELVRRTPLRAP